MKVIAALLFVLSGIVSPLKLEAEPKRIKIGAILGTTGSLASMGVAARNGVALALEEVNQKYPFKLEVLFEDDHSNATDAVTIANKFIELDGIKVIIGPLRSNAVLAVAPIAELHQVLLFTPGAASSEITQAGDFVFRNRESGGLHALETARYLIQQKLNKVALFTADSANSITYGREFKVHFPALGGRIVYDCDYEPGRQDFYTEIVKARASHPDALYLSAATGSDAGILVKQIRQSGFKGPIFGTPGFTLSEFCTGAGEAANGIIFTAPAFDPSDPRIWEYTQAYQKKYGTRSDVFSANAYDALMLLAQAIQSCDGDRPPCMRDYLYGVHDYPGVSGLTSFDRNGDVTKPIDFFVVEHGQNVKYRKVTQ